jgi:SAM-dependent methyltransferase
MISGFSYSGTELDALAGAPNYYRAIIDRFRPYLGRRVVEVGAGVGTFARFVLGEPTVDEMTLVEPADNNLPTLRERFAGDRRVTVRQGYLEDLVPSRPVDSIVAVNVLEHVEDDQRFLRAAHDALLPGGHILLFIPALSQIFGTLDEAFGHFRRYTKPLLATRLAAAGFSDVRLRYTNFPGIASWYVAGRVLRKRTLAPRDVRVYDRVVMPWVTAFERFWEPPLGQSIIAIGTRPPAIEAS